MTRSSVCSRSRCKPFAQTCSPLFQLILQPYLPFLPPEVITKFPPQIPQRRKPVRRCSEARALGVIVPGSLMRSKRRLAASHSLSGTILSSGISFIVHVVGSLTTDFRRLLSGSSMLRDLFQMYTPVYSSLRSI